MSRQIDILGVRVVDLESCTGAVKVIMKEHNQTENEGLTKNSFSLPLCIISIAFRVKNTMFFCRRYLSNLIHRAGDLDCTPVFLIARKGQ